MRVVKPSVTLLWITKDAEKQIEIAGRTCYKSEDKITNESSNKFVNKMIVHGHEAMIEHAIASFKIVIDRGITHEIVRHRLASYAQESTRYCNYANNKFNNECSFIQPPNLTKDQLYLWEKSCQYAEENYFKMMKNGCAPQIARSVLPTCLKAEIVMTANFREWRHFIKLRGSKAAHPQIRPIAFNIYRILKQNAPSIFNDLNPQKEIFE